MTKFSGPFSSKQFIKKLNFSSTSLCRTLKFLLYNPLATHGDIACENSRFSSLLVAGDVSRGGTSATQCQKFHTDDVKSVRNPVISAD